MSAVFQPLNYESAVPPYRSLNMPEALTWDLEIRHLPLFGDKNVERHVANWLNRLSGYGGVRRFIAQLCAVAVFFLHFLFKVTEFRKAGVVFILGQKAHRLISWFQRAGVLRHVVFCEIIYSTRSRHLQCLRLRTGSKHPIPQIVLSERQIDEVKKAGSGCPVYRLLYGIDTDFWQRVTTPLPAGLPDGFVLCVGDAGRDDETLLEVASRVPLPFVRVCRNATVTAKYRQAFVRHPELHDRVTVLGYTGPVELRVLYSHATCTFLPLRDENEPWGLTVALESLACGTPVITNHGCTFESLTAEEKQAAVLIERGVEDGVRLFGDGSLPEMDRAALGGHMRRVRSLRAAAIQLTQIAAELRPLAS